MLKKIIISMAIFANIYNIGCNAMSKSNSERAIEPPVTSPDTKPKDLCRAEELQYLIGKPKSVLETMRFSQVIRVLEPGSIMTMDYSEKRLNIYLDEKNNIKRLSCG